MTVPHDDFIPPADPLQDLLETLDLEDLGSAKVSISPTGLSEGLTPGVEVPEIFADDFRLFRGKSQKMPHGRVFGGQVLAQGVVAAGRTVTGPDPEVPRRLHSLHAYFMRPGDDTQPITFAVERMRDGRSFSTRRVHALQHGKPILSMSASFQDITSGIDHQDGCRSCRLRTRCRRCRTRSGSSSTSTSGPGNSASPDRSRCGTSRATCSSCPGMSGSRRTMCGCAPSVNCPTTRSSTRRSWRMRRTTRLEPALRRHGLSWNDKGMRVASLDHAMWFHRPARADEFILYAQESPSAQGSRGMAIGRIFTVDGTLAATVAQEGMMRVPGADARS